MILPLIFSKMAVDYNYCDYLSPHKVTKYGQMWGDVWGDQVQYIYNRVLLLTRKLDGQYQWYNKSIHEIFLGEIPLLLPKLVDLKRCKRGLIGIMFKVIVGITSEAVPAFIR